MSPQLPSLTIFFPCYNDEHTIGRMVLEASALASTLTSDFEILVIDDGSSDRSLEQLEKVSREAPSLRVIQHRLNRGYGAALSTGFGAASKEWVFYTDGDGQYDVGDLALLAVEAEEAVDVVNGYKRGRSDPWYRTVVGLVYRRFFDLLFRFPVQDVTCGFRLIRRSSMDGFSFLSTSGAICVELVTRLRLAGAAFREVVVTHRHVLSGGHSSFGRVASRSRFSSCCGYGGASSCAGRESIMTVAATVPPLEGTESIPQRVLGKTGERVPILGLGTAPGGMGLTDIEAVDVIHAAIDEGITYLDTAPGYARAQIQLGEVLPNRREEVFLVTKTLANTAVEVQSILEQSLRDLKTDAVDLTFVHSVGSLDPERILAADGALAGLREAQRRGLTRYVGFTAHHRTSHAVRILNEADPDVVMFAVNYVDRHTYDFQGEPLALARAKGLGVAAMKVFGGAPGMKYDKPTRSLLARSDPDAKRALDYALALPGVTTAVVGMFSTSEVAENAGYARAHTPLTSSDVEQLEAAGRTLAAEWKDHYGEAV